jgi:ATP-dependent DNA helicase PIF1
VFKLAPTGVAAHNIAGQTLHRFFGMANRSVVPNFQTLDEYIKLYPKIVLLIDEYSMISATLLHSINDALIKTTNRATIMGGVKTIFFGDIAQLLPVEKKEASMWNTAIYNNVNRYDLIDPVRQSDESFIRILNKVRLGFFQEDVIKFINERTVRKNLLPLNCLRLYTTRERVRMANEKDFKDFPGEEVILKSIDTFVGTVGTARKALKETRLSQELSLKVGMPVMLIQNFNISLGWVNGTIASIFDIDEDNIGLKKFGDNDEENGEELLYRVQRITRQVPGTSYVRSQFPIIPAFASTIHKSQSATIDCVGIYLDNMLTHGQLYVAMSRVKKASDLFFFGASLPLAIKRKYGVNVDAINISRKKVCVDE